MKQRQSNDRERAVIKAKGGFVDRRRGCQIRSEAMNSPTPNQDGILIRRDTLTFDWNGDGSAARANSKQGGYGPGSRRCTN